ncbi:cytochrome P450 monooxygenase pc-3 [Daedaleopsis nitida]|nr:cytochrome P450 monooxygenase pc-3 [Daedaleopsis nitida]
MFKRQRAVLIQSNLCLPYTSLRTSESEVRVYEPREPYSTCNVATSQSDLLMTMAFKLPPGIPFLFRYLLVLFASPFAVYLAYRVAPVYGIVLSPWIWAFAGLLVGPLVFTVRVWLRYDCYRRGAQRCGAVLPADLSGRWIGNWDILQGIVRLFQDGYPSDMFDIGFEALGPVFQNSIFWDVAYVTKDPNVIKTVLATEFANYEKGEVFHDYTDSVLGSGVFNSDGDLWKFHRSMSRPFFSRDRISHFDVFERHADVTLKLMKERSRSNIPFDFQDLVGRFALDSATEYLLGSCVHSLHSTPLPYPRGMSPDGQNPASETSSDKFPHAFATAQRVVAERPRVGWLWPLTEMFGSKTDEPMAVVDAFIEPILREAIRKKEERANAELEVNDKAGQGDETLLDHLVQQTSDAKTLHDETLNILIAGRDTMTATLTFGVYLLCQHPADFKRLRDEVAEYVGLSRRPTYDDIKNMKYIRAFLNETLRLYPPVPFNVRLSVKEGILPNPDPTGKPIYIPPKTRLIYCAMNMQRDPAYWGPTAEEFDPDRFLDERVGKYLVANPYIFLPFNGGPRICLGQQFAYNEMSFFMIRLMQNFSSMELDLSAQPPDARPPAEWKAAPGRKGQEQIRPRCHLTMYAEGGLWVKMGEANHEDTS